MQPISFMYTMLENFSVTTHLLLPHALLLLGVLALLVLTPARWATFVGLVTLAFSAAATGLVNPWLDVSSGMLLEATPVAETLGLGAYLTAAALLLLGENYCVRQGLQRVEYAVLILLAGEGIHLLTQSQHFVPFYIGVELMSLSFYVLTAFHPREAKSAEAGVKYFTLGGLASALILFGLSFFYAISGSLSFDAVQAALQGDVLSNPAVLIGSVLILSGILFKLSIVPFHMWTADVYTGAPLPVMIALATLGKIGAVAVFMSLLYGPLLGLVSVLQLPLMVMAALSMFVGALLALQQTNLQRILAYSSITHMGFVVMALLTFSATGLGMALFFTAIYVLTMLAIGAALLCLRRQQSVPQSLDQLTCVMQTHPQVASSLLVSLLSLAGLPPFVGFFAKVYVLQAAYTAGLAWLAGVAVVASAIAVAYSLKILQPIFFGAGDTFGWEKKVPLIPCVLSLAFSALLIVLFVWHQTFMETIFAIARAMPYMPL